MFEYHQNTLCVVSSWLWENNILTAEHYRKLCSRGHIKKLTIGGNGRKALVAFESIPERFKKMIREKGIDPYASVKKIVFSEYMHWDHKAEDYYRDYLLDNGTHLPEEKQQEYTHQAIMFNTVKHIAVNVVVQKRFGGKKQMWERMLEAIQNLPETWLHTRYKNVISFKRAFKKYEDEGYGSIVSGKWLNSNPSKIVDDVADFILSQYCLPVKYTISEVIYIYNSVRETKGWKSLTERAVGAWLDKTEQKRIWMLARDGKEEYMKHFGHTVTRNRTQWFPNAWWAIDGTKLDLVHFANNKQKMAAELKINVVFDVYSEKIIGWDIAYSENHASHFRAIKRAVNESGCKPFLFTYDKQSGHTSARMQDLYDRLPAKGGTHYSHKVGRKSSPAEQIFNRLQQQVISKMWFSDKQGIKVRKATNKPNTDFIVEYKEALPTVDDFNKIFQALVNKWNAGKQEDWTMSRIEMYEQPTEHREEIDMMDQLSMFWIDETKPKKYYAHGLPLTVEGQDYIFEVYDANGKVDMDFRWKWVNEKIIVRYDPEYLNDYVALYELTPSGEKRFITYAQKKRAHESIPILMVENSKALLLEDMAIRDLELKKSQEKYEALIERTGITRESLIEEQELMVKFQGHLPKEEQMVTDTNAFHSRFTKY
ncbi:transposase family protein [Flavobacterium sp. N1994]|uniref:transposase family protein n=1 Tax=Flavobacterium sp. N1994 TaxID=2986827 RepID=UPI002221CCF4|nr:transposase family protein [Flavobacterium sp. N1994]